jgi:chitosanase
MFSKIRNAICGLAHSSDPTDSTSATPSESTDVSNDNSIGMHPELVEEPVSSTRKKRLAKAIVSVFETGKVGGDYAAVALLPDGAGVSYGIHQATDRGGNLDQIILRYADLGGAYSSPLSAYLEKLDDNETARFSGIDEAPPWLVQFIDELKKASSDPIMRQAQDQIFDEQYWQPAAEQCRAMKLKLPLSWAVVYDTCIHSGPNGVGRIRRKFPQVPPSRGGDEREWTRAYVNARRNWLANYGEEGHIVRRTVVRMDVFLALMDAYNWELALPIRMGSPYNEVIESV